MRQTTFLLSLFSVFNLLAQEYTIAKIIVDTITRAPLPYVDIYNSKNHVTSNEEGRFEMVTTVDSLSFHLLGFHEKQLSIDLLKKENDTIFLQRKEASLNEVRIKDYKELLKSTFKNYRKDLLSEHSTHHFYLRAVERRDNKIVTLIDLTGKALYQFKEGQPKYKAYDLLDVEIEQQRSYGVKTHIFHKQSMPKLFQCLWAPFSIHFRGEDKKIKDTGFVYDDVKEIAFQTLDTVKGQMHFKGHFLVDALKEQLVEYKSVATEKSYDEVPFKRFLKYRFRQVKFNKHNIYEVDTSFDKMYPKYGSFTYGLEAKTGKQSLETFDFDIQVILLKPFSKESIKPNVKVTDYLIDIEKPYDASFWKEQKTLKLTKEEQEFIQRIRSNADFGFKRNKIISNE